MSKKIPTVLVTGANRGLGLEVCRQLGQKGFRVVLTARDARQGRAAAERLATEKIDVAFRSLDVSNASSIAALAKELIADGVKLDVLVNRRDKWHRRRAGDGDHDVAHLRQAAHGTVSR